MERVTVRQEGPTVKYLLLIYYDEGDLAADGTDAQSDEFAAYTAFNAHLAEVGGNLAAEALQSVSTATTVRVRNDEVLLTDGPFAETKEQLGGFYLVEAADLDAAIELASRIPSVRYGSVEVRPIWEWVPEES